MKVDLRNILRRDSEWAVTEAIGVYFVMRLQTLYQYAFFWFKANKQNHISFSFRFRILYLT